MSNKSTSICTANEEGILALAFACLGQDAGIPDMPYLRIFPTSVEQCFNAIHGRNLVSEDPDLSRVRSGEANINLSAVFNRTPVDSNVYEDADDEKEKTGSKAMVGEIGRIKSSKSIRQFVSTMLPISVVDQIYNKMSEDAQKVREAAIEARAFAARIESKNDNVTTDLQEDQLVMFA